MIYFKRGTVLFFPTLLIFYFILLLSIAIISFNSEGGEIDLGVNQLRILGSHIVIDDFNLFKEEAVRISSIQSLYYLGKNGGFFEKKCEKIDGYPLLGSNCNFLQSIENDFYLYFNNEINKHLGYYKYNPEYSYKLSGKNLRGTSKNILSLNYQTLTYHLKGDFYIELPQDIATYKELYKKVDENRTCLIQEAKPETCIEISGLKIKREGDIFFFDLLSKDRYLVIEGESVIQVPITFKFAMDLGVKDLLSNSDDLLSQSK
ncbi:MAG: hypothetical protein HYS32_01585 [Candidatus Woesearchaeota archaeon]|nr:MAG: hypothetical protein HYS32_01585 [Candidatus Woesearchaeota archaeon]